MQHLIWGIQDMRQDGAPDLRCILGGSTLRLAVFEPRMRPLDTRRAALPFPRARQR